MDELIAQVSQRTGLSPEHSRQAAEAVLGFLKGKLPAPIAAQIDGFLAGGTPDIGGALGGLAQGMGGAGGLGGMFGKKES